MIPIRDSTPSSSFPIVTVILITTNLLVALFQMTLPLEAQASMFYYFGLVPARLSISQTLVPFDFPAQYSFDFITSQFLHGGWLHLLANMWSLWIFGDNVEDQMGSFKFLGFYLFCGFIAFFTHYVINLDSTIPVVGASGAVAGVLGAYFRLFPRAQVTTLIPIIIFPLLVKIPALAYLGIWFVVQLISGALSLFQSEAMGGIAFWVHVGGFLAGLMLYRLFLPRRQTVFAY